MSKNFRIKEEVAEVNSARSKLDGVLQTLVEQKDDRATPEKELYLKPDTDVEVEDYSPLSTPTKRSPRAGKSSRKRKVGKDDYSMEYGQYHHSYVMKLFDRSVDLALYSEDTPLYPVCRAWIRNEPHGTTRPPPTESPEKADQEREVGSVFELPPPVAIKQEEDHYVDLRVPSPLPPADEPLDIYADQNNLPDSETLLINHMLRWKQVRQKWKNAARLNEMQYADSLSIIKDIYDRQNC